MNSNESSEQTSSAPVPRRNFIKSGIVGAGAFAISSSFPQILTRATDTRRGATNILFIICDQWRFPQHLTPEESAFQDARLPNYNWLYERSVKFFGHYGAAAACTPVRSTILTGLYTHQTGILNTFSDNGQKDQANTLNPGFLTWGKALRELGYQTVWWGKWHESPAIAADLASAGSALMGTLQFATGAICMIVAGLFFDGTPLPMIAGIAICAVITFIIAQVTLSPSRDLPAAPAD